MTNWLPRCSCKKCNYCPCNANINDDLCAWCSHRWHRMNPIKRVIEKTVFEFTNFQFRSSHTYGMIDWTVKDFNKWEKQRV